MAKWVNNVLSNLFDKGIGDDIVESLARSQRFTYRYDRWKTLYAQDHILFLHNLLMEAQNDRILTNSITVLQQDYATGIHLEVESLAKDWNWEFALEYLKDSLLQKGYRIHKAERRTSTPKYKVNEVQHYFLKPTPSLSESNGIQMQNQYYGNVILELTKEEGDHKNFKIQANYYSGFNYTTPIPLTELFLSEI